MKTPGILLALLIASTGLAQQPDSNPAFEAILRAQARQMEARRLMEEEERQKNLPTIKQNAADYKSDDPEIRRRAVLILGKYKSDPVASMILKRALKDPEAAVRQASLVALIEPFVDKITANSMLLLMNDPDVSIRRICSAALPGILISYGGSTVQVINGKIVRGPLPMPEHLKKRLRDAHKDPDEIVRKNMVDVWSMIPSLVDEKTFLAMLKDESRDVRISALDNGNRVVGNEQYYAAIVVLIDDKDQLVRLRLAAILSFGLTQAVLEPLQALAEDRDFDVSNSALLGLMAKGRQDAWETLKGRFSDGRLKTETATKAIGYLSRLGAYGQSELKGFLNHTRTAFRAAAAETLTRSPSATVNPETVLNLIADSDMRVRTAGTQFLLRNRQLAIKHINTLATSPHKDIRLLAVSQATYLKPQEQETILMDMFLDSHADVRCSALERIANLRLEGWRQLLTDALDDDDKTIQECAVNLLLTTDRAFPVGATKPGSSRMILLNYLNTGKDETLKIYIRKSLSLLRPTPRPLMNR